MVRSWLFSWDLQNVATDFSRMTAAVFAHHDIENNNVLLPVHFPALFRPRTCSIVPLLARCRRERPHLDDHNSRGSPLEPLCMAHVWTRGDRFEVVLCSAIDTGEGRPGLCCCV